MIRLQLEKQLDMTSGNKKISLQFDLQKGKTLALYGPSGCGKTSLLRMIAGLMQPDKGKIVGYSSEWYNSTKKIFMPPQLRSVGMVFQDYALFPNMTIEGNLRFAAASNPLLDELLKATDLWSLRHKKPGQLSGGQQQRLALARALIQAPKLLLLDEAFSALDKKLRQSMHQLLLQMQERLGLSIILVSHQPAEILHLAQSILVFEDDSPSYYKEASDYFNRTENSLELKGTIEYIGHDFILLVQGDQKYRIPLQADLLDGLTTGQSYSIQLMGYYAQIKPTKDV